MNVLSLFDGMSCGQIALERCGIFVDKYFASEIDKAAISVTMDNYPNTIQLGSVVDLSSELLPNIDLLIGGSPCQGFSKAGKMLNFDDPRSKLFFEFVRIKNSINPKYFLLENVQMKKEYENIISYYLGVRPIRFNSSLVSAQNRKRLYWTNIPVNTIPQNKHTYLKNILQDDTEVDEKYFISEDALNRILKTKYSKPKFNPVKTNTLNTVNNSARLGIDAGTTLIVNEATKAGFVEINVGECVDLSFPESKTRRGRRMLNKANCLMASEPNFYRVVSHLIARNTKGITVRRLTPIECERLQTVPDNYTAIASDSQRYKMLGNGWTIDIICHIFNHLPKEYFK